MPTNTDMNGREPDTETVEQNNGRIVCEKNPEGESKTAFIAIVGCPNAGKSTVLNKLIGEKIAIVSPKPQTTRSRIMGVLTKGNIQLVFTDTPGYHKPKNMLGENMIKAVNLSVGDVDDCLLVTEAQGEIKKGEIELIEKFKKEHIPAILAINKIDLLEDKSKLLERIQKFSELYDFKAVVPISAKKGTNMAELEEELMKLSFPSAHFFPDDTLTDQPEKVIASEIVREKLLDCLDKEVPHGTAVEIERFSERKEKDILDIDAVVYCEKDSHKAIIIGKNGAMLKKISTLARKDMEKFFGCKVSLHSWVKVKEGWRNKAGLIRNFGLEVK